MKKNVSIGLVIILIMQVFFMCPLTIYAVSVEQEVIETGTCGSELTWTIYDDYSLAISGDGYMSNFSGSNCPWYSYRKQIQSIIIGEEVTSIGNAAFAGCNIESIVIPNNVEKIGSNAFSDCSSLEYVHIGSNVKTIGGNAFYKCNKLTNIVIPDSVTTINSSFNFCENLKSVSFGTGLKSINGLAFQHCEALEYLYIPASVSFIDDSAFVFCYGLKNIEVNNENKNYSSDEYGVLFNKDKTTLIQYPISNKREKYVIPEGVTLIAERAFAGRGGISRMIISGDTVTYEEFENNSLLKEIVIPNTVTSIGNNSFEYCHLLESVVIPDSVISIDKYAFNGCKNLEDVYYSGTQEQWNKISIGVFNSELTNATIHYNFVDPNTPTSSDTPSSNTAFLYYVNENKTCSIYDYVGDATNVVIPEEIDGLKVTEIYSGTFGNIDSGENGGISDSEISSISIPKTITEIGDYAFKNCSSLEEIIVDSQNTHYKTSEGILYTFDGTKLVCYPAQKADTYYTIPSTVSYVYNYAFYYCSNLLELNATHTMKYQGQEIIDYANKELIIYLMAGSELHINAINKKIDYKIVDIYNYTNDISGFDLKNDGYSFINAAESFNYSSDYKIPLSVYQSVFGDSYTQQQYESEGKWNGNCFGMSLTAALFDKGYLNPVSYGSNKVNNLYDSFNGFDGYARLNSDSELKRLIECYQVWQSSQESDSMELSLINTIETYEGMFLKVIDILQKTQEPLLVCISWDGGGHALVVDSTRKPENLYGDLWRIYLYDPNNPYSSKDFVVSSYSYSETRYIDVNVKTGEWYIDVAFNSDSSSRKVGYDNNGKIIKGSNVYFFSSETATKDVFSRSATITPSDESNKTAININDNNIIVLDNNNNTVFRATDGIIDYKLDEAFFIRNIGNMDGEESALSGKLILPKGTYSLSLSNKGCAQVLNANCFVGITSSGNTNVKVTNDGIVYCNGDEGATNSVVIEKTEGDSYTSVKTVNEYSIEKNNIRIHLDDDYIYTNSANDVKVEVISNLTDDKEYIIENYNGKETTSITNLALEKGRIAETEPIIDTPKSSTATEPTESVTDIPKEETTQPISEKTTKPVIDKVSDPTTEKPTESMTAEFPKSTTTELPKTEPTESQTDVESTTEPPTYEPTEAQSTTEPITETSTYNPTEAQTTVQPTTKAVIDKPTLPTQSITNNPVKPAVKKIANTMKVKAKAKTVKIKKLKFKKQTVKPLIIKKAKGRVTVTLIKKGKAPKIYKKIKINRKTGAITFKKGNYVKGKYKIRLRIKASGNTLYNAKVITKKVVIKIR